MKTKEGECTMYNILQKRELNEVTTLLKIDAPLIARKVKPGQFVIVRSHGDGERLPLTIADFDAVEGSVTIIFQKIGAGTLRLGDLKVGESVSDLAGPLGVPTHLDGLNKVAVIGGGVGCAIAFPQAKYLFNSGKIVHLIAGFRNKDIVILEDEMKNASTELNLATDDGSYGQKGFVTNILKEKLDAGEKYDAVIAIGPLPMMRAVCNLTKEYSIPTIVSLNPIMIDGTGMCGGCRVTVGDQVKFACVDGPDFDGHLVDFDELMRRNAIYKDFETKEKEHVCRMLGGIK